MSPTHTQVARAFLHRDVDDPRQRVAVLRLEAPAHEVDLLHGVDVDVERRPAEQCVVLKSWNMPDGTPAMLVSSHQTGEQMMIVPGTGWKRLAFRTTVK